MRSPGWDIADDDHVAPPPAHRRGSSLRLTRRGRLVLTSTTVLTLVLITGVVVAASRSGSSPGRSTLTAAHATAADATTRRTTTSAKPTVTPTPTVARDAQGVPIAVEQAFAAAGGDLSVACYDATDGRTWTYHDEGGRVEASVSKLSVLGAVLRAQQAGAAQTDDIADDEADMIERSDNDAATDLYDREGRSAVEAFDAAVGAGSIVSADDGLFGLDTSTALDQVEIMKAYAYPNAVLTTASRSLAASLFGQVEADQHWGASGGVPTGVTVDLKDGWLPHGAGWVVDTVGHVSGEGHDYVVAIMSAGNATEQAGIGRLEAVSAAVWKTSGS
jgi:hypothetical protein